MKNYTFKKAFTLVEMMIAVTLFTIVVMSTIQATMTATAAYRRTEALRISLDTSSFLMEDMSRNIKLGTHFDCNFSIGSIENPTPLSNFSPCNSYDVHIGLAFDPQDSDPDPDTFIDNTVYQFYDGKLYKSTDGATTFVVMTPPEMVLCLPYSTDINCINRLSSGFVSNYNTPLLMPAGTGNSSQPLVSIRLSGYTKFKNEMYPFSYQTLVTPRVLDYEV